MYRKANGVQTERQTELQADRQTDRQSQLKSFAPKNGGVKPNPLDKCICLQILSICTDLDEKDKYI